MRVTNCQLQNTIDLESRRTGKEVKGHCLVEFKTQVKSKEFKSNENGIHAFFSLIESCLDPHKHQGEIEQIKNLADKYAALPRGANGKIFYNSYLWVDFFESMLSVVFTVLARDKSTANSFVEKLMCQLNVIGLDSDCSFIESEELINLLLCQINPFLDGYKNLEQALFMEDEEKAFEIIDGFCQFEFFYDALHLEMINSSSFTDSCFKRILCESDDPSERARKYSYFFDRIIDADKKNCFADYFSELVYRTYVSWRDAALLCSRKV